MALTTSLEFRNSGNPNKFRKFGVKIPGDSSTYEPCYQPGTYTERFLNNGNVECSMEVFIKTDDDATHATTRRDIVEFFTYAQWLTDSGDTRSQSRIYEADAFDGTGERYARIFGGSITPRSQAIVNRFGSRNAVIYILTYERSQKWNQDFTDPIISIDAQDSIFSTNVITGWGRRISRLKVKPNMLDHGGLEKVWMGLHDTIEAPGISVAAGSPVNFDPEIVFRSTVNSRGVANRREVEAANQYNMSQDYFYEVPFYNGGNDWRTVWYEPLRYWNSKLEWGGEKTSAELARRNMIGKWLVLMRFQIYNNALDDSEIAVRLNTFYEDYPDQYLSPPQYYWIKPWELKERNQTVQLGIIDIGGEDFSYGEAQAYNLGRFCIGLDMKLYGNDTGTRLFMDRLALIPANRYVVGRVDENIWANVSMSFHTDADGMASAYLTRADNALNDTFVYGSVPDFAHEGWSMPMGTMTTLVASTDGSHEEHQDMTVNFEVSKKPHGSRYI